MSCCSWFASVWKVEIAAAKSIARTNSTLVWPDVDFEHFLKKTKEVIEWIMQRRINILKSLLLRLLCNLSFHFSFSIYQITLEKADAGHSVCCIVPAHLGKAFTGSLKLVHFNAKVKYKGDAFTVNKIGNLVDFDKNRLGQERSAWNACDSLAI